MPSGWIRWLLEQFEFPFEVVYPQTLDAGNLEAKYDVLLFPDGAIPEPGDAVAARLAVDAGDDAGASTASQLGRVDGGADACRS